MRLLAITPEVSAAIRSMRERAAANPVTLDFIRENSVPEAEAKTRLRLPDTAGKALTPTEQIVIPNGFRVAYSVEHQPGGLCGHLSISVDRKGKLPHPEAVAMIANEFGMSLDAATTWLEEFDPGHEAVNIVQPISAPATKSIQ